MKKFKFSLQRILDYRQSLYEKEKNTLSMLHSRRAELEQQRQELLLMQVKVSEEHTKNIKNGITPLQYSAYYAKIEGARLLIKSLDENLLRLKVDIEKQTQVVVDISKSVKSFENLRERKLQDYNVEVEKVETERIAELISNQLVRTSD